MPGLAAFRVQWSLPILASHFSASRTRSRDPRGPRWSGVSGRVWCWLVTRVSVHAEKEDRPHVALRAPPPHQRPLCPRCPALHSAVDSRPLVAISPATGLLFPCFPLASTSFQLLSWTQTHFPAGDGHERENSPIVNNGDMERESFFEGKNMALFEVRHTFSCRKQGSV